MNWDAMTLIWRNLKAYYIARAFHENIENWFLYHVGMRYTCNLSVQNLLRNSNVAICTIFRPHVKRERNEIKYTKFGQIDAMILHCFFLRSKTASTHKCWDKCMAYNKWVPNQRYKSSLLYSWHSFPKRKNTQKGLRSNRINSAIYHSSPTALS